MRHAAHPVGNICSGILACKGRRVILALGPFDLDPGFSFCDCRRGGFQFKLVLGRIDPDDGFVRSDRPAVSEIGRDPDHAATDFGGDLHIAVQCDPAGQIDRQRLFGWRRLEHCDGWLDLVEGQVGNGVAVHLAGRLREVQRDPNGGQYQRQLRVTHPLGTAGSTLGLCRFLCHRSFRVRVMDLRYSIRARRSAAPRPRVYLARLPSRFDGEPRVSGVNRCRRASIRRWADRRSPLRRVRQPYASPNFRRDSL